MLNCYFIWYYQIYIYTYNRQVSRLQELISLTKNRKLGERMVYTLTCKLCFIQSCFMGDEIRVKMTKKNYFYKVHILECELDLGSHPKMWTVVFPFSQLKTLAS
jgi:hypothetical protein